MKTAEADRRWQRAWRYIEANQTAPARAALESILLREPEDVRARVFMAAVCASDDQPRVAAEQVRLAGGVAAAASTEVALQLASIAIKVGEPAVARQVLNSPTLAQSNDPEALLQVTESFQLLGDYPAALRAVERARQVGAHGAALHFYYGMQLGVHGRLAAAEREFARCVALDATQGHAFLQLAGLRKQTPAHNHVADLQRAIGKVDPRSEDHVALLFALYKELDDLERYDEAWRALELGNRMMHAPSPYDAQRETAVFARLREICQPAFLHAVSDSANAGPQPIFVIGLPRSGTTLLERILGNHSQVESAGELPAFLRALSYAMNHLVPVAMPDAVALDRLVGVDWELVAKRYLEQSQWRAHGKSFYVDKLPRNWMLAGLIHKALPHARMLNLVRDPMDVCFSNWRAHLGAGPDYAYAYDLDALAAHHHCHRELMRHWRRCMPGVILDVDYARLVREPETVAREAFTFCGLPNEPGSTDLTRNQTPSATLSMAQIRQPIHARSARKWVPYAGELAGLSAALAADELSVASDAGVASENPSQTRGGQTHA